MLFTGILICCTGPFWSSSLCLFGFCLPSLQCLISSLTQVGRGDLLFRFTSSVQSCYGKGGALQADVAVCGEHSPCSGRTGFVPLMGVYAFPVYTAQAPSCSIWSGPALNAVPLFGYSTKARIWLHLRFVPPPAWAAQAARDLGALSLDAARLFPPHPQRALPVGCLRLVFVCSEELAFSWDPPGGGCRLSRISGSL